MSDKLLIVNREYVNNRRIPSVSAGPDFGLIP